MTLDSPMVGMLRLVRDRGLLRGFLQRPPSAPPGFNQAHFCLLLITNWAENCKSSTSKNCDLVIPPSLLSKKSFHIHSALKMTRNAWFSVLGALWNVGVWDIRVIFGYGVCGFGENIQWVRGVRLREGSLWYGSKCMEGGALSGSLGWGVDVYASRVWMRMIKGCGCV